MIKHFHLTTYPQEILLRPNALDELPALVAKRRWSRALLVTTRSQRANGTVARIEHALGEKLVGVFDATQPHVPQTNVDAVHALAQERAADVLIALGGGSAIGVAKATTHTLQASTFNPQPSTLNPQPSTFNLQPSVLAIPTTYAGSEMTPVFGVTRARDGIARKETMHDPRSMPQVVLYDPMLTLDLPPELTAATGVNAFAHCVEAVYSITRNPLSSAAALEGAKLIYRALPRCYANGGDLDARTKMLTGACLAGAALANVAMGLHHGVCHVLGGTLNLPHGVANAIVLPHAIRFNADACAAELAPLARGIGLAGADDAQVARELADTVARWIQEMNLPARLRAVGVRASDLPLVAELAFQSRTVQNNPKKIESRHQLELLLDALY